MFAKEILPRLERELGPEGFKVHVVGEGEPPPELAKLLPRPSVKLCGRIEPADSEFLSADIQLVPTPFVLGIRLRIIVGFSFGCCVVAHTNETLNLPEMIHEENALLASDGPGLAETIIRAARDPKLRERLGVNARRTYERYFAPEVAAAPIVAELERLAWERRRQLN
ncbi:MAG: glycosyltransferase [Candidatus Brocadiales bacterium]|nr:glycosyltransferase [Candidatus Bathyanammoxibius sp.]